MDNKQRNDEGLRELALFAGAGGGILGGHLLGWRTVAAVEYNAYARSVLLARQNDGTLPPFPIWDDVRTFDGKPWCGIIDVVSGGFPCQDISVAGKQKGIEGDQSGLWLEMARIIFEVRPKSVYVENSANLLNCGIGKVLGDLASMGFDARWGVLGADDLGGDHQRKRIWISANAKEESRLYQSIDRKEEKRLFNDKNTWEANPWDETRARVRRMDDGLAFGVDRFEAIGNGQVAIVAKTAREILNAN